MSKDVYQDERGLQYPVVYSVTVRCDRNELGKHPKKFPRPVVAVAHLVKDRHRAQRQDRKSGVALSGVHIGPMEPFRWMLEFPGGGGRFLELGYHPRQLPEGEPNAQDRATVLCPRCGKRGDLVDFREGVMSETFNALRHAGKNEITLRELGAIVSVRVP